MSNRNELKWSNAMAPETANKVPAWDASGNPVVVDPLGGSAADIAVSARGIWEYQSATGTPVADGKIRFNSTTIASITQMLIAQTTDEGTDAGFLFATLKAGDDVYFQLRADATKWLRFTLSATPVDNGSWWTMAVTLVGSGGALPGTATKCIVRFTASNLAYNYFKGSYTSLGALNSAVPTASPGDYALVDVAASPAVPYFWDATDSLWRVVGGITLGAIGSTPNANAATLTGSVLNLEPASASFGGLVTTGAQTLAGAKTFSVAPTFSTMTIGSVFFAGTAGLLSQDNTNFKWDNTNKTLIIGAAPSVANPDLYRLTIGTNGATTVGLYSAIDILGNIGSPTVIKIKSLNGTNGSGITLVNDTDVTANLYQMATGISIIGLVRPSQFQLYTAGAGGIFLFTGNPAIPIVFATAGTATTNERLRITDTGLGIFNNAATPTAKLHIAAHITTAGTAPLKLTSGTAMTTPEDGAIEYHGSHLWFTVGSTRYQLDRELLAATSFTQGSVLFAGASGVISESNTQFFWDTSQSRLAIGHSTPLYPFHLKKNWAASNLLLTLENTNVGSSAGVGIKILADTGTGCEFYVSNSTSTATGNIQPNQFYFDVTGSGGLLFVTNSTQNIIFALGNAAQTRLSMSQGGVWISNPKNASTATASACLHLPAGVATAGGAPIKLTSGVALTTPEQGALEYHSLHLWFTIGSTRYQLDQQSAAGGLTSVGLTVGVSGTDVNVSGSPLVANGSITLNIPNANVSSRGVVSTTAQFFGGDKSFANNVYFGAATSPTARVHIEPGTAAVNTAPIKLTSGTALSTPENGAVEFHSSHLWFTIAGVRYQLDQQSAGGGVGIGTANQILATDNSGSITEWKTISLGTTAQANNLGWVLTGGGAIVLHVPDATGTVRGVVTAAAQTFGGAKTFATSVAITGLTAGSVLFYTGGVIAQNNAQLFWSTASTALCIGTLTPLHKLTVDSSADSFTGMSVSNTNAGVNAKAGIHFATTGFSIQVGITGANTVTSGNKKAGQLEFSLGTGGGINVLTTNTTSNVTFCTNNDNSNTRLHVGHTGVGIGTPASVGGVLTPTAALHLPAGAAAAGSAPLKFITGTAMTTPEDGALEYHTSHLYFTIGSTRFQLDQQGGGGSPGGANTEVQINNSSAFGGGKLFISTPGNLIFGDSGTAGSRTLTVQSSSTAASMAFEAKGGGSFTWLLPDTTSKTVTLSSITPGGTLVRFTNSAAQGAIGIGTAIASINDTARIGGQTADYIEFAMVASTSGKTQINCALAGGAGAPWTIKGMNAGGTNQKGGDVIIEAGNKIGTGLDGNIYIQALTGFLIIATIPTSSAGLPSGAIWSNSNVLTRVP